MARAIIYTRVSTEEQAASGLGLEAQESSCRRHCELRGLEVVAVFSDPGVSGRIDPMKRKGFLAAQTLLESILDGVLVVASVSRLTRRQGALWRLIDDAGEVRLRLQSATESFDTSTAMGRAMVGMLGVWAQLEADMISDRTKSALAARRARGFRLGAVPLSETRPEIVDKVGAMHFGDGKSYAKIAFELNLASVPGPRGGKWHISSVRAATAQYLARLRKDDAPRT
jgi:DNA invertase Pin-like site-specific DNA recombinase